MEAVLEADLEAVLEADLEAVLEAVAGVLPDSYTGVTHNNILSILRISQIWKLESQCRYRVIELDRVKEYRLRRRGVYITPS